MSEGFVGESAVAGRRFPAPPAQPAPPAPPAMLTFLVAVGVSWCGDALTLLAASVVVYRLTGSPAAPAGLILARLAPRLLGPALGGILGDLLPVGRALSGVLALQGAVTVLVVPAERARSVAGMFVALGAAQLLGAVARPMVGSLLARLVAPSRLGPANAALSMVGSLSILVAPALGVGLLEAVGATWLFLLDAISFAVAAGLLALLRPRPARSSSRRGRSVLGHAAAALPALAREPLLRLLTSAYAGAALVAGTLQSALVVIAATQFGGDDRSGYLWAAVGAGGALGGALSVGLGRRRLTRPLLLAAFLTETLPLVALLVSSRLTLALLVLTLSSAGAVFYQASGNAELARLLPPDLLARGSAAIFVVISVGQVLGSALATALIPAVGWRADVGASLAVAVALVVATLLRDARLRRDAVLAGEPAAP